MAIGAVALSLPFALFGSLYMSVLNGLVLWQGIAAYSAVGFVALLSIFMITAIDSSARTVSGAKTRGPWR